MDDIEREEKIMEIEENIEAKMEKFEFDTQEKEVYEKSTEVPESEIWIGKCPHCSAKVGLETNPEGIDCPSCEKLIEFEGVEKLDIIINPDETLINVEKHYMDFAKELGGFIERNIIKDTDLDINEKDISASIQSKLVDVNKLIGKHSFNFKLAMKIVIEKLVSRIISNEDADKISDSQIEKMKKLLRMSDFYNEYEEIATSFDTIEGGVNSLKVLSKSPYVGKIIFYDDSRDNLAELKAEKILNDIGFLVFDNIYTPFSRDKRTLISITDIEDIRPKNCVMISNRGTDLNTARNIGMETIHVSRKQTEGLVTINISTDDYKENHLPKKIVNNFHSILNERIKINTGG